MREMAQDLRARPIDVDAGRRREEALRLLARRAARRGYRIARDLLGTRADAEDAVQEALARAVEGWERLRDPDAIDGWFLRVLVNLCMRTLRRRGFGRVLRFFSPGRAERREDDARSGVVDAIDPRPGAEESVGNARAVADLLEAVEDLPPMQRAAVVLRYGHDLPVPEIADALGVGTGTVKTHLVRGLDRLRSRLAGGVS